jgi:transcriptional regulator with XRE-family HTH domain
MRGIDVKKKIIESGVSLKEVSEKMNVSPQALQNLLKASDMKIGTLSKIAKAINKNIYFFIEEYERSTMESPKGAMPFTDLNIRDFLNIISKQQECINELSNTIRINSETINLFLKQGKDNTE